MLLYATKNDENECNANLFKQVRPIKNSKEEIIFRLEVYRNK